MLALSALLSRLLGLWRDHLLARAFGASAGQGLGNLDAYYAAFRIPDLLYSLLVFGAVSAAFIPCFARHRKQGRLEEGWIFAGTLLNALIVLVAAFSAAAYFAAPWLLSWLAPGFDEPSAALAARLMRIMLLSPLLFAFSAVFTSIQDSFRVFFFRSLAPLLYNLGIILGIFLWAPGWGVLGVTWGVVLGAFLQLGVQWPGLRKVGYRYVFSFDLGRADIREAFRMMLPRILGLSLSQLTLLANTFFASLLGAGSIAILSLAENLQAMPLGIVGISFAIASFATLSELAEEEDSELFSRSLSQTLHKVLFLILPASFGLFLLRRPLVELLFLGGKFTLGDARLTAQALGFFLLSLFAQCLIPLLARGFYALRDARTPLRAGALGASLSLLGSALLGLGLGWGVAGIALAYSAGALANGAWLYAAMAGRCKKPLLEWGRLGRMLLACGGMLMVSVGLLHLLPAGQSVLQKAASLLFVSAAGAACYFAFAKILGIPERSMLWDRFRPQKGSSRDGRNDSGS